MKKEEKRGQWPPHLGEDIRLPPPQRHKDQKDNDIDW
jgi:hypothetical protein